MRAAATLISWAAVGDVVLGQHGAEAAEAGGLDGVDADVEEGGVHPGDDVGPGQAQHLVAAFEGLPAEVVGREVETLDVGAEGAVEDDDPLVHRLEVGLCTHWTPHATGGVASLRWDVQNSSRSTSLPARMAPAVVIVSRERGSAG